MKTLSKILLHRVAYVCLLLIAPMALTTSCAVKNPQTVQTPAQNIDLQVSRALVDASAAIEEAKKSIDSKPAIKGPLNKVIEIYNSTLDLGKLYHESLNAGGNPSAVNLLARAGELKDAVAELIKAIK